MQSLIHLPVPPLATKTASVGPVGCRMVVVGEAQRTVVPSPRSTTLDTPRQSPVGTRTQPPASTAAWKAAPLSARSVAAP